MNWVFLLLTFSWLSFAYEITSVKVEGQKGAEMYFQTNGDSFEVPSPKLGNDIIEFLLTGATLNESFNGMVDLKAPHALIERVLAVPTKGGVKVNIVVSPGVLASSAGNKKILIGENGVIKLRINYPEKETPALKMLQEEQKPLAPPSPPKAISQRPFDLTHSILLVLTVAVAAGLGFFVFRYLKGQGRTSGKRKYLIEQMANVALGPKNSISLLRVGREFILVGVTPQQISFLSALPQLTTQYQEESREEFNDERSAFHEAVEVEMAKIKRQVALPA